MLLNKRAIYLSIDGMTDPLGQAQVVPYLKGLAEKGIEVCIISCEKKNNFARLERETRQVFNQSKIEWEYVFYSTGIPLFSQWWNLNKLKRAADREMKENPANIVHCRSYMAGLTGLYLKRKYRVKFIFDMRGFWPEERVEGKTWNLRNPLHRMIFKYFKRKERELLLEADHIITLTGEAKRIIHAWEGLVNKQIEVIPCCADVNLFKPANPEEIVHLKSKLNIPDGHLVFGYLGSLGTWYMLDEMLDLFSDLLNWKQTIYFLFITLDKPEMIFEAARKRNIPLSKILVAPASRNEVPKFISIIDWGIFFIRPSYSKKASSPTKLAEILACDKPIITNAGIGDVDEIILSNSCGILVKDFERVEYEKVVLALKASPAKPTGYYRKICVDNFSLEKAVGLYEKIYNSLV